MQRDLNAAKNILHEGLRQAKQGIPFLGYMGTFCAQAGRAKLCRNEFCLLARAFRVKRACCEPCERNAEWLYAHVFIQFVL